MQVIRRVGGLEVRHELQRQAKIVIRRVGGLEEHMILEGTALFVIRRVGGLEVSENIELTVTLKGYPPCRRLRRAAPSSRYERSCYPPCRRLRSKRQ